MKNFDMKKINQAGSLMIEAIAMLGLISLVTPVVYKKSAERMTELQDINAASHLRMLSSALDAYISDNYDNLKDGKIKLEDIEFSNLENYLPKGALVGGTISGPLGDNYMLSVQKSTPEVGDKPIFTGYVAADVTDDKITPQRTSRIATMIGGNGAVVDGERVYGVQGTWETEPAAIGLDGISDNSVVVASQNAVGASAQIDTSKFLYRVEDDVENNTMQTNLYMSPEASHFNSIEGVGQLLIGYQAGRDGQHQHGTADTNSLANYGLYVNGSSSNTWLGGSLEAAQGKLSATETTFKYNPYTSTTGEGNTTAVAEAGLVVDNNNGMSFSVAGNDNDKFTVNNNQLKYANNLIVAENGAGDTTKQAVRFFASSTTSSGTTTKTIDTSAATFTEGEARFFGETDGPKVSIKKDGTTIKNQLVAMNPKNMAVAGKKTTYTADAGFKDYYTRIGESAPAESNYNVLYSNAKNANILSGRTIATQLETGYLKSDNFDTKSLRAGRNDLKESKETWNLDVNEKGVKIGYKRKASNKQGDLPTNYAYINVASGGDLAKARQVTSYNEDGTETLKQGTIQLKTAGKNSSNKYPVSQLDIGRIYKDDGKAVKNVGGIAMTVSDANIENKVTDGQINLRTVRTYSVNGNPTTKDNASLVMRSAKNDSATDYDIEMKALGAGDAGKISIQAGQKVATTDKTNFTNKVYDGAVEIKSVNLLVKNEESGESHTGFNDEDADAWVYIRKGAIDLKTDKTENIYDAASGTGYVKADRFVVDNVPDVKNEVSYVRNPNEVYKDKTIGQGERYDHYMVDPAYTSVMHDIKLTSRGGARLSDILPDFINKGIYVTDNSYGEGTKPRDKNVTTFNPNDSEYGTKGAVEEENAVFASAFLGVVPAPQCPPGYAKVITLTPAGWRMAQIGTLVEDSSADAGNRLYLNESTPMYGKTSATSPDKKIYDMTSKGLIKGDIKEIPAGGGSITIPRIFQQNTWLKSAIKLNLGGNVGENNNKGNEYSTGGQFVGWNTYMGFIYPSVLWSHLFDSSKTPGMGGSEAPQLGQGDNKIYWNLFPVDKWSIEGYATVYCYFDRNGLTNNSNSYFNENMVDTEYNQYSSLRTVEQGVERSNTKYIKRLNNPKLKYTQEW